MAGPLVGERLDKFLSGATLARLACVRPDGTPTIVPVWYHWDGTAFWFVGRKRSAWCIILADHPRAAAVIDVEGEVSIGDESFLTPRVIAEGDVTVVEEPGAGDRWVPIARAMAERYRGAAGLTYLESTLADHRWLVKLVPDQLQTWEGGGWARRYKEPGNGIGE